MDRAVLGAARAPPALGLHAAVIGLHAGLLGSSPDAVGDLVEAVLERLRSELDRLKEDVVLRIARHGPLLPRRFEQIRPVGVLQLLLGDVHTDRRFGRARSDYA